MSAASFSALGVYPALAPSGSSSARFTPHQFRYNGRVALTLLPSLGVSGAAQLGGAAAAAA